MGPDGVFFSAAAFFLLGVLLKSAGFALVPLLAFLAFSGSALIIYFYRRQRSYFILAALAGFILIGAFYFSRFQAGFQQNNLVFGQKLEFSGIVANNPKITPDYQQFKLKLASPFSGTVLVRTDPYPPHEYGDLINLSGAIKPAPANGYGRYLAKEGISGLVYYPRLQLAASGKGSAIKRALFQIKNLAVAKLQKTFSFGEASFLSGLLVGDTSRFSPNFKEAMARSGTTHLTALSGYNIAIIISALMGLLIGLSVPRKAAYFVTVLSVVGFVVMTGAEASVVRAAIMGIIVILAWSSGRIFDVKNAIILAAVVMVLINPLVLAFDIGFQLSFLAVLGLVYLKPALDKLLRLDNRPNFSAFNWRDNLSTTYSAQLAVLPLLIFNFNQVSISSFLANLVILSLIPATMLLGFLTLAVSFVSAGLSFLPAVFTSALLNLEIGLINFFGSWGFLSSVKVGWVWLAGYYLALILFIRWVYYKYRFNDEHF